MGKPIRVFGINQDITEQKKAEEERFLKEILEEKIAVAEESLKFKQNFLANMSHEIRTPLTGILGMADLLSKTNLSAQQSDYLSTLQQSGDNLREIINNVLDFSKIEAGKVMLKERVFQFKCLPENAKQLFKSICRKPIAFDYSLDPNLPEFIKADSTRLTQVINNLVSNAVKFTEKGKVSLKAELLFMDSQTDEVEIKIAVSDTGKGIPKSVQEELFKPFSQIDENDTRHYEGTGLGLSISKEFVKLHGGEIHVESVTGEGSTFWFTFKAHQAKEEEFPIKRSAAGKKGTKSLRILLAEDKVVNQSVISLMLASFGHQVHIAGNGAEALQIFEPRKFDFILMDIQMPVMDGITATQKLKDLHCKLPPIVGLSANAFEGDKERYMEQGLDEYLTKPLNEQDFHDVIEKLFG